MIKKIKPLDVQEPWPEQDLMTEPETDLPDEFDEFEESMLLDNTEKTSRVFRCGIDKFSLEMANRHSRVEDSVLRVVWASPVHFAELN